MSNPTFSVVDHLETIRNNVRAMDAQHEGSMAQLPMLQEIRDAANRAIDSLVRRQQRIIEEYRQEVHGE